MEENLQKKTYKYLNEKLGFINKYKYGFYVEEIDNQDVIEGAKALITAKYFISKGINRGDLKEIIKGIDIKLFRAFFWSIDRNRGFY